MTKTLRLTAPPPLAPSLVLLPSGALASAPVNASPAALAGHRLVTNLRPSGDPDGSGKASIKFSKARGRVCATITWQGIVTPDAAHIHRASDGSIVVDLTGSVT